MRRDDAMILREVQRNAGMGKKALGLLMPMVEDRELAGVLSRQELEYSRFADRATGALLEDGGGEYRENVWADLMLKGGIRANTLFDTSTTHLAQLVVQGSSRGWAEAGRTLNRCDNAGRDSTELAMELMNFEKRSMDEMKKYL